MTGQTITDTADTWVALIDHAELLARLAGALLVLTVAAAVWVVVRAVSRRRNAPEQHPARTVRASRPVRSWRLMRRLRHRDIGKVA